MQGVLQKWEDNGEGELIYEWVKNPAELYNSGKSKMAKAIWDWSPTVMTPQGHLSKEDVKSIFAYVDAYAPPVAADGAAANDTTYEAEDESVSFWWWIVIGLLIFVLFATFGVRRELSEVIAAKEGAEVDPKKTFIVSARKWALRNWFVTVLLIVAVALVSGVELLGRLYQVGVYQDYQPLNQLLIPTSCTQEIWL